MDSFYYNGQIMRVLDMDAERDSGRAYIERSPTFAEKALEEITECTYEEKQHKFLTVFSESCLTWRATNPEDLMRLTLVGQSYVCSKHQKRLTQSNALMVFYRKNGKFVPLYELHHLQTKKHYVFLSRDELTQKLGEVFNRVKLTLGVLHSPKLRSIAWSVETEEGTFYIPWHNGCIIPAQAYHVFEEKRKLEETKGTYSLLRFAPSPSFADSYYVLCC